MPIYLIFLILGGGFLVAWLVLVLIQKRSGSADVSSLKAQLEKASGEAGVEVEDGEVETEEDVKEKLEEISEVVEERKQEETLVEEEVEEEEKVEEEEEEDDDDDDDSGSESSESWKEELPSEPKTPVADSQEDVSVEDESEELLEEKTVGEVAAEEKTESFQEDQKSEDDDDVAVEEPNS